MFADRGCHVVSVTDPYCHILELLDQHGTLRKIKKLREIS
jgi:hypothetical protein